MATIAELFALALEHHQAGRLQAAEQLYRQILQVDSNQADVLHLLGFIAYQVGKPEAAVEYILRAIRLDGNRPTFHHNLGDAYRALGRLSDAVACYQRALQLQPELVETLHNLGLAWHQLGMLEQAVACYQRVLQLQPNDAQTHTNLGLVFRDQGRLEKASNCYRRALELNPGDLEANKNLRGTLADHPAGGVVAGLSPGPERSSPSAEEFNRQGVALAQQGRFGEAVDCFQQALQLRPGYLNAHNNLGNVLMFQGRLKEAVASYQRALELLAPADVSYRAGLYSHLGNALRQLGRLGEAVAYGRRALEVQPDFAEAHGNLGNALQDQGRLDEAVVCYQRALELKPDFAEAHSNLGNAMKDQGKLDEAVACCRRALELKPDHAGAHNNLGLALQGQGKLDEAVVCYRRALDLQPDFAEAHSNLGNALRDQGKLDEAVACYRRALEVRSDFAEAHNNLGNALRDQGKLDQAVACYRRALDLKPDYALAHWNRSLLSLLTGDFERGWPEYEWRWRTNLKPFVPRPFQQAIWDGRPLEGGTILLHAEQGLGDTLQFIRYAPLVQQRGPRVLVECPQPLRRLLAICPGIDQLVGGEESLPDFGVHASLLSLPRIFQTSLENLPSQIPYLFAAPDLMQHWHRELGPLPGFKIGIVWQGSALNTNDRSRSIPLSYFEPLARLQGVRLFSLQKGTGVDQLATLEDRFPIAELGGRLDDFMDTAAVLMNLDLVIACDTAVVHLAGALGVPVWVALPFVPDWRWLLDRHDSPWYPTMRLFRQDRRGHWQSVFERIETALREHMTRRARPSQESNGPSTILGS